MFKWTSRLELFPIRVDQIAKKFKKRRAYHMDLNTFQIKKKKEKKNYSAKSLTVSIIVTDLETHI